MQRNKNKKPLKLSSDDHKLSLEDIAYIKAEADEGEKEAQYRYGRLIEKGRVVDAAESAEDWYKKAAEQKYSAGMIRYGKYLADIDEKEEASVYLKELNQLGCHTVLFRARHEYEAELSDLQIIFNDLLNVLETEEERRADLGSEEDANEDENLDVDNVHVDIYQEEPTELKRPEKTREQLTAPREPIIKDPELLKELENLQNGVADYPSPQCIIFSVVENIKLVDQKSVDAFIQRGGLENLLKQVNEQKNREKDQSASRNAEPKARHVLPPLKPKN